MLAYGEEVKEIRTRTLWMECPGDVECKSEIVRGSGNEGIL